MDDKSAPTNTNTVKSLSVEGIHSVEGIPSSAASVSAAEEDQLSRRPTSFTVKTLSVEGSSKAAASVSTAEEDQLLKDGAGKIEVAEGKADELLGIATLQSWESDQLPVLAASRRDPLGGGVGGNQSAIGFGCTIICGNGPAATPSRDSVGGGVGGQRTANGPGCDGKASGHSRSW